MGFSRKLGFASFLLVFLLMFSLAALADEISVSVKPVKDSIMKGEQSAFELAISNRQDFSDTFRFSLSDVGWDVVSDPLYHYFSGIDIPQRSSGTVRMLLKPLDPGNVPYGQYRVDVIVTSDKSRQQVKVPLFITLRPSEPLIREYLAAVRRIVELPSVVDPRQDVAVRVNLVNRNPKNITAMRIVFSSKLLNGEVQTSLEPLESKSVEHIFSLNPLTPPQDDVLIVRLIVDGAVLEPTIEEKFRVGAYSEINATSSSTDRLFLKTVDRTAYSNIGNVNASKIVEFETGFFRGLFVKTEPDTFAISKGGKRYLAWELSLGPDESVTVIRTESYRSLLLLAAILAAGIIAYYLFRSPVFVIKRASIISLREGAISEMKIILHIKNRSDQPFDRLTVIDYIPTIADVTSDADVGGVKPTGISQQGNQTIVKWEIDKLEKREERVMSYRIRSRLSILGSVTLPGAYLKFYSAKGTKLITHSRKVNVKS